MNYRIIKKVSIEADNFRDLLLAIEKILESPDSDVLFNFPVEVTPSNTSLKDSSDMINSISSYLKHGRPSEEITSSPEKEFLEDFI